MTMAAPSISRPHPLAAAMHARRGRGLPTPPGASISRATQSHGGRLKAPRKDHRDERHAAHPS